MMLALMMTMMSTMNEDIGVDNKLRYHTMIDDDGDDANDCEGDDSDNRLRYQTLMDDAEEVGDDVAFDEEDDIEDDLE